jgi:hypothetical protein
MVFERFFGLSAKTRCRPGHKHFLNFFRVATVTGCAAGLTPESAVSRE